MRFALQGGKQRGHGGLRGDAVHCQRATAEAIVAKGERRRLPDGGQGYQPTLHDDVRLMMDDPGAPADDAAETVDADHGRIETRRAEVLHDVQWLTQSHW